MIKLGITRTARFSFRVSDLLVLTVMSETGVAEKWWQKPEDLRQGTSGFRSTCLKLISLQ